MKKLKSSMLAAGVVSTVALASITGAGLVSAATPAADGQDSLVGKIAKKFNLKQSEVKAVFDEERTAHHAEQQKSVEAALAQAVTDGKLTSDQKDKILAKRAELQASMEANRPNMKNKTQAEHKATMDKERAELKQWATDNNIPEEYLRYVFGHGGEHKGHEGHGGPEGPRHHGKGMMSESQSDGSTDAPAAN